MVCVFFVRIRRPPISTRTDTRVPDTTLFRSTGRTRCDVAAGGAIGTRRDRDGHLSGQSRGRARRTADRQRAGCEGDAARPQRDRQRQARTRNLRRRCEMRRSEEHTSELQSLMRISYAVFCLKKKNKQKKTKITRSLNTSLK